MNGELITVSVDGNLHMDNGDGLRQAAVAGLGIASSTSWLFREDIEQGTVVTVLNDYEQEEVPLSVLYSAKRHLPAKVKTVVDFLAELTSRSAQPHERRLNADKKREIARLSPGETSSRRVTGTRSAL